MRATGSVSYNLDLWRHWQHEPRSATTTKNKGGYMCLCGWAVDTCDQEQAWLGGGVVAASAVE